MIKSLNAYRRSIPIFLGALPAIGLLGLAPASFGTTIDPTTFTAEENISDVTFGVVLSAPNDPNGSSVLASGMNSYATMGSYFGDAADNTAWSQATPLEMLFSGPIVSLSVTFTMDGGNTGYGELTAYNSTGGEIGDITTTPGGPGGELTLDLSDISYAIAYIGGDTAGYDEVAVTLIDFTPGASNVPDQGGTMMLFGIALGGLGLFARKFSRV